MKKIVVGISGASSVGLGLRMLEELSRCTTCYAILSQGASRVWREERGRDLGEDLRDLGVRSYGEEELEAGVASGSFGVHAMAIVPTSMNTLAKIACGMSDDLISRCASVMLKERRTLLLAPRELPLSSIALENMLKLSRLGVIIAPPILGYYAGVKSLEEMEDFVVGKWLDVLGIPNALYRRWREE